MESTPSFSAVEQAIRERKTVKLLAQHDFPATSMRDCVDRLLAVAGWAPFHKVCHLDHRRQDSLQGIEPWRFHCLDAEHCRRLGKRVQNMEAAGKIPMMLAAADAMIMATWLPNPLTQPDKLQIDTASPHEIFEPTIDNVEHIAAASAAVQNLLVAATAAGIANYWSSGGVLRQPAIFKELGISADQRLLGAIFLFPNHVPEGCAADVATSKLREQRSSPSGWSRWLS